MEIHFVCSTIMSLIADYIDQNPQEITRLFGIDCESLEELIAQAESIHRQQKAEIEKSKVRIIAPGGGNKPKLSIRDEILLTLTYMRQHPTFQWLGISFGVSESTANTTFHYWINILGQFLSASMLQEVELKEGDLEYIKEVLTQYELIVDTSEQPRQRPKDKDEQEIFYSGYKHMHTFKNQFIILPGGKDIIDIVAGEPGPKHDLNIFRENRDKFDSNQRFKADKSYIGELNITTPHKKPKQGKLTEEQDEENKVISGQRVFVEHVIRLVKIFRISQQRFRLRCQHYKKVIQVVCGLVRLRIGSLILPSLEVG